MIKHYEAMKKYQISKLSSNESIELIFIKWIPDTVGFLKMYSFIYLSFQLFEIRKCTYGNVRGSFLDPKIYTVTMKYACYLHDKEFMT